MPKAAARTKVEIAEFLTRTSADTLDMCCPTEDRQEGRSRVPSPVKLKRSHQVYVPASVPPRRQKITETCRKLDIDANEIMASA
jgi:hypothetical protein